MRVTVDLDPVVVWRIQELAEKRGVTAGVVLRDELARSQHGLEVRDLVRAKVLAGSCDADIAAVVGATPGWVAKVRRGLGLPANRRYQRAGS